jgi:hypothetical protein
LDVFLLPVADGFHGHTKHLTDLLEHLPMDEAFPPNVVPVRFTVDQLLISVR